MDLNVNPKCRLESKTLSIVWFYTAPPPMHFLNVVFDASGLHVLVPFFFFRKTSPQQRRTTVLLVPTWEWWTPGMTVT